MIAWGGRGLQVFQVAEYAGPPTVTGGSCKSVGRGLEVMGWALWGTVQEKPIGRGLQEPAVISLDGSLSRGMNAPAIELETHVPEALDRIPVGAY